MFERFLALLVAVSLERNVLTYMLAPNKSLYSDLLCH